MGGALGWLAVASMPVGPHLSGPVALRGVVVGSPSGRSADVRVEALGLRSGGWSVAPGRVRVRFKGVPPHIGTAVVVHGFARPMSDAPVLPGAPDGAQNALRAGVVALVHAKTERTLATPPARPARDVHPVLRALATGDRSGVSDDTWQVLRDTGTAHLLAISGFHVGLVAWLAGLHTRWLIRPWAVLAPEGLPERPLTAAVAVLAASLYTVAAGSPVSAQRALLMVCLVACAHVLGRAVRPLALLAVAAMVVVVLDPSSVGTPGFQLSFGAVIGLIRVTPWLLKWVPPDQPWLVEWVITSFAVTVGATIGTLPAAAWWFQQLAPWSPVANLYAIPVVAMGIVPCALVAEYAPLWISQPAATMGAGLVEGLLWSLRPLAVTPWAPAIGPVGALIGAALLLAPRRLQVSIGCLALFSSLKVASLDAMTVHFLDVGQGDAALVEWPDGRTWLVDGGPPSDRVLKWMRRQGHRRVDVVVVSHGQLDHYGGVLPVLESLDVGEVWVPSREALGPVLHLAKARQIPVQVRPAQALHPAEDFVGEDINDRSLVVVARHGARSVLFTGDIEAAAEAAIPILPASVDVLKVPHHGSRSSSTPALLDRVRPAIAVASMGRGNRYRHPAGSVVAGYEGRGIALWRTDRDGTVVVSVSAAGVGVRASRE